MKLVYPVIFILNFTSVGFAMPSKYSKCQNNIVAPVNSGGYFNSDDCNAIYVLPPNLGEIKITGPVLPSDQDCGDFDNLAYKKKQIDLVRAKAEEDFKKRSNKDSQLIKLKEECDGIYMLLDDNLSGIEVLNKKQKELFDEYKVLVDRQSKCKLDSSYIDDREPYGACNEVEKNIYSNQRKSDLNKMKLNNKKNDNESLEEKMNLCNKLISRREKQISLLDQEYQNQRKQIDSDFESWSSEYSQYDSQSRASGSVSVALLSKQESVRTQFENMNSGLSFENMPIDLGVLNFQNPAPSIFGLTGKQQILAMNVNGAKSQVNDSQAIADVFKGGAEGILMGESVGASLQISNAAACNVKYHAKKKGTPVESELKHFVAQLAPTFSFKFGVQVGKKIVVRYNEQHLYQLIKKSVNTKGLFRSSSASQLLETSESEKWISVEISNESPSSNLETDLAAALEIRKYYLDNALLKAAKALYSQDPDININIPTSTGAPEASKALRQCSHLYCQYAAIGIDLVSSISSGTTAESEMSRIVKSSVGEDISVKGPITHYGTISFKVN
jgi:hypothetical protein